MSDHFTIPCTYRPKNVKANEKQHTSLSYRCFKKINIEEFHNDLQCQDLKDVEL